MLPGLSSAEPSLLLDNSGMLFREVTEYCRTKGKDEKSASKGGKKAGSSSQLRGAVIFRDELIAAELLLL